MPTPDQVFASSWNRAWETARILEDDALWPAAVREPLLEDADETQAVAGLLERLGSMRSLRAAALIGHEPFLSRFASRLVTGRADGAAILMRKGAVLELEVDPEGPLGAAFCSLVHPGIFRKR